MVSVLNFTGSGAQTVVSTPTTDQRDIMTFTSRLRTDRSTAIVRQRQTLFGTAGNGSILQTTITMRLNPKSVKWTQSKRITKKDTRNGSTYFHFNNTAGQNNDILTLAFAGNTGNLDARGSIPVPASPGSGTPPNATDAQLKLLVWHNLYLMTREPMLLADGSDNVITVLYRSALFSSPLTMNGFFQKVMEFEESAAKPNSRDYSFEFTVTSTSPDLDRYMGTLGTAIGMPNPVTTPTASTTPPTLTTIGTPTNSTGSPNPTATNSPTLASGSRTVGP